MKIAAKDLVVGRTYRVTFEDCCVDGWFEGEYVGPTVVADEDESDYPIKPEYITGWLFSTGQIGPANRSSWTITEVKGEESK